MDLEAKPKFSHLWPQWLAAVDVFILEMVTGMSIGWLSPFLGLLRSRNSPYEVTTSEISWSASLIGCTKPLGVLIGSLATHFFGSKRALNICIFFHLTGYMFLIFADSIELVYMTFICKGLNLGASMSIYPVYISEISAASIRGTLITVVMHGFMIGLLFGNLMGTYLRPHLYASICIAICILFLITFFFLPQSPHYLVHCKKMEEAVKSMRWYTRGEDIEKAIVQLSRFLDINRRLSLFPMLKATFKNPVNRKMLFKLCIYTISLQMTGLPAIGEFAVILLTDACVTAVKPTTVVTIMTLICIPASWITMYIIDKYKSTNIYLINCISGAISLIGFAVTFTIQDSGNTDSNIQWIIIMSAFMYRVSITIGMMPFFSKFMSEMFAPNVKTIGIALILSVNGVMTFFTHKCFLYIVELITYKYVFYITAGIAVIHGIYVKLCIPETKGKTLQEIQMMLNENKKKESDTHTEVDSSLV